MFGWGNAFPGRSQQLSGTRGMQYATVSWCILELSIVKNCVSQNCVLGLSWFPLSAMSRPVEDTIDLRLRGKYVCYAAPLENQFIYRQSNCLESTTLTRCIPLWFKIDRATHVSTAATAVNRGQTTNAVVLPLPTVKWITRLKELCKEPTKCLNKWQSAWK